MWKNVIGGNLSSSKMLSRGAPPLKAKSQGMVEGLRVDFRVITSELHLSFCKTSDNRATCPQPKASGQVLSSGYQQDLGKILTCGSDRELSLREHYTFGEG